MLKFRNILPIGVLIVALSCLAALACSTETIIVQTVEVEVAREVKVVETVVVEKERVVEGQTVVQTVVVERERVVEGETVVQTVIVERERIVEGQTVVETVVVEKEVVVERDVEVAVEVEKVVTATAEPTATPPPATGTEGLRDVPRNRTLVIAVGGQQLAPANMNLLSGGGLSRIRSFANQTWLEFPFYYGHHNGEVVPWTAKDWQYNDTYDEVTITFRDDVHWSDGTPFTAEDVRFTWQDLIIDNPTSAFHFRMKDVVESVELVDDYTIKLHLTRPDSRIFLVLFQENTEEQMPVLPKHIWEGKDPETFENVDIAQGWPVGTGAFKLVKAAPEALIFDRDDNWWAAKAGVAPLPAVERIVFAPSGDEQSIALRLSRNEIDHQFTYQNGLYELTKVRNPNVITWQDDPIVLDPNGCMISMTMNNKVAPFDDPAVRRALNFAISKQAVVNIAFEGTAIPVAVPLSFAFPGPAAYYEKIQDLIDADGTNEHNPDKAAAIMEAAGYTKNDQGFWADATGEALKIELWNPSPGYWKMSRTGTAVVESAQSAGFDAVERRGLTGFWGKQAVGDLPSWLTWHCGSTIEPYGTYIHWHSNNSAEIGETVGYFLSAPRYENPEYDAIIDQMGAMEASIDDPEYIELFRQATEIILRDMPEIQLVEDGHINASNTTYWTGWPSRATSDYSSHRLWAHWYLGIIRLQPTGE